MKVLALVPSRTGHSPGQRGSIELWEPVLNEAGIELVYAPFETEKLKQILNKPGSHLAKTVEMLRGYAGRIGLLNQLDEYDAVFVYREAALFGPAFLERQIARKKPIIYQLDDPLFVPYRSPSNGYLSYLKFFGKVREIIRISKVVIVNSTPIEEFAAEYNRSIWKIPSLVDTKKFVFIPDNGARPRVCVGWSGSPTTLGNLKLIEEPLTELTARNICDLHFIGGTDFELARVNYSSQPWSAESEVDDLRRLQVGLVPLPDNAWNRYKFIMKTAQYMALGIVPVGTPMASNTEVISHGENGFLAATHAEWVEYITLLVEDSDLRREMSSRAAKDAGDKYSLAANAPKILEAFRAAVA